MLFGAELNKYHFPDDDKTGFAYHVIIQERFHCQSIFASDDYPPIVVVSPTRKSCAISPINASELCLI